MKKNKSKQVVEIANIKGTRDIFGRLLYLSVRKNIDLNIVFQYPLLPQPPCFVHSDESSRESKKSSVTYFLKEKIDCSSHSNLNTVITDGMFVVRYHSKKKVVPLHDLPDILLLKMTNYRLNLCFDIYESPSIKDIKRK